MKLIRARCGGFVTPWSLVEMKQLPKKYKEECPLCKEKCGPDLAHLLVCCRHFDNARIDTGVAEIIKQLRADIVSDAEPAWEQRFRNNALQMLLGGKNLLNKRQLDSWYPHGRILRLQQLRRRICTQGTTPVDDDTRRVLEFGEIQTGRRQTVYSLVHSTEHEVEEEDTLLNYDLVPLGIGEDGKPSTPDSFKTVEEVDQELLVTAISCGASRVAKLLSTIDREVTSCIGKTRDLAPRLTH